MVSAIYLSTTSQLHTVAKSETLMLSNNIRVVILFVFYPFLIVGIKFDYVLSIDVQTTCWPGKTKKKPELSKYRY